MKCKIVRGLKLSAAVFALSLPLFGQESVPVEFSFPGGAGRASIAWSAEPGTYYEILTTTNLTSGVWNTIAETPFLATGLTARAEFSATNPTAYFQLLKVGTVTNDMVYIPAGSFSMGDNLDGMSDAPVHSVYVSGFYMGKTEVTKAQWDEVYTWAVTNGYSFTNAGSGKASSHPVQTVSWYDTVKWCNARSEKEGKTPCYTVGGNVYRTGQSAPSCNWSAGGYRLPTEAEWEKAARGGVSGKRFPWGDTIQHTRANYYSDASYSYDTSSTRGYHPTYATGGYPYTSPAGSFAANGYGLYDMAGNVWEWCWDWYDGAYYSSSPSSNPHGASTGSYRVGRGGRWNYFADYCRAAYRFGYYPDYANISGIGFRVVLPSGQ